MLAELPTPDGPHPAGGTVVGGAFGGPLRPRDAEPASERNWLTEEHIANFDAYNGSPRLSQG